MTKGLITVPTEDLRLLINGFIDMMLNHSDATEIDMRTPQPEATEGWRVVQDLLAKHDTKGPIPVGRTITLPQRVVRDVAEYFDGKDNEEILEGLAERADQQDYKEVLSSGHPLDVLQVAYSMYEAAMMSHAQYDPVVVNTVGDLRQAMLFLPDEMIAQTQVIVNNEHRTACMMPLVVQETRYGNMFVLDASHPQLVDITIQPHDVDLTQPTAHLNAGVPAADLLMESPAEQVELDDEGLPKKIAVNRKALRQVVIALSGAPHLIRELQVLDQGSLQKLDPVAYASPIGTLRDEVNAYHVKHHKEKTQ